MDDTARTYRLKEAEAAARLRELTDRESPSVLTGEIGLCRYLIEQSANSGNHALTASLMTVLNKLARTHDRASMLANETLGKTAAKTLIINVLAILGEELDGVPDAELRLERASMRILESVTQAANPLECLPRE